MPVKTSEKQPVVGVSKGSIASNLPLAVEDAVSELNLGVAAIKLLINLEEEPIATDMEEEPEATVDLTIV